MGCSGFYRCAAWAVGVQASVLVARGLSSCGFQALECQLNICGEQALLLHSIWDPPGSGVKPVSPALTSLPLSHQGSPQFSHSVVSDSDPMDCSTPGFLSITNSQSLLKLLSIESVMPSNHLILCLPLLLLPSAFFQHHGLFPMSQFFTSDGQNFGASASVRPMNIQD